MTANQKLLQQTLFLDNYIHLCVVTDVSRHSLEAVQPEDNCKNTKNRYQKDTIQIPELIKASI